MSTPSQSETAAAWNADTVAEAAERLAFDGQTYFGTKDGNGVIVACYLNDFDRPTIDVTVCEDLKEGHDRPLTSGESVTIRTTFETLEEMQEQADTLVERHGLERHDGGDDDD